MTENAVRIICGTRHILVKVFTLYHIAQNGGGKNLGKFGKSVAFHQSFTHPNLYHKTAGRLRDESILSK